jgi:hypothetical protein
MTAASSQPDISACDGRRYLGAVAMRAGKHVAVDAEGKRIGAFATRKIAFDAITARAAKAKERTVH